MTESGHLRERTRPVGALVAAGSPATTWPRAAVPKPTENPGRVSDRGLCRAVLGGAGGPPSKIILRYDQILGRTARDLSQRSAQPGTRCLRRSNMVELHP